MSSAQPAGTVALGERVRVRATREGFVDAVGRVIELTDDGFKLVVDLPPPNYSAGMVVTVLWGNGGVVEREGIPDPPETLIRLYRGLGESDVTAAFRRDADVLVNIGYTPETQSWVGGRDDQLRVSYRWGPPGELRLPPVAFGGREPAHAGTATVSMNPMLRAALIVLATWVIGSVAIAFLLEGLGLGSPSTSAQAGTSAFLIGLGLAWIDARSRRQPSPKPPDQALVAARVADVPPPLGPAPTIVPATKVCPDCAETVQAAARICRYCRYEFAPRPQ